MTRRRRHGRSHLPLLRSLHRNRRRLPPPPPSTPLLLPQPLPRRPLPPHPPHLLSRPTRRSPSPRKQLDSFLRSGGRCCLFPFVGEWDWWRCVGAWAGGVGGWLRFLRWGLGEGRGVPALPAGVLPLRWWGFWLPGQWEAGSGLFEMEVETQWLRHSQVQYFCSFLFFWYSFLLELVGMNLRNYDIELAVVV